MNPDLTWEKPGQDAQLLKQQLTMALSQSGVCVMLEDEHSEYLFIANLFDCWEAPPDQPPNDLSLFGPVLAEQLGALKIKVRSTGEKGEFEFSIGTERHFLFVIEMVPSSGGSELLTTIIDFSEERRRETVLRTLLREVSHRSKNLLAIIQSIAAQTARHSGNLDQFLLRFRGRLYSLSHSQDLVTDSSWRGARFHDLVREQLHRFIPETEARILIQGENALLSPNAALHLGLALHELIVNAVSHGNLLTRQSGITVSCTHVRESDRSMICFTWHEDLSREDNRTSSNSAKEPHTPHFGSAVLQRVVPASVAGEASYVIGDNQISYRLVFPVDPEEN